MVCEMTPQFNRGMKAWLQLSQSMVNHGWLRCHFTNHGWPWLMKAWPEHGQPWLMKAWPEHGQPWLVKSLARAWATMVDWGAISQTMVDHGQWNDGGIWSKLPLLAMVSHGDHGQMYLGWPWSAMVPFFKSMVTKAEPWPANQARYKYPLW